MDVVTGLERLLPAELLGETGALPPDLTELRVRAGRCTQLVCLSGEAFRGGVISAELVVRTAQALARHSLYAREEELNEIISRFAIGWDITRISRLARSVMQLAIFEIQYLEDVPTGVAVSEAVRIAKKYDGDDTGSFVNGILGSFVRAQNAPAAAPAAEEV